nr:TldD/PmbA family protein [uncultured Treponema sp.]
MTVNIHRLLRDAADAVPQAEWIGLRRVTNRLTAFSAIDGKFDQAAGNCDEGIMLEVLYKGTFSYAATADVSSSGIKRAAERAFAAAQAAQPYSIYRFDQSVRPAAQVRYTTKREKLSGIPAAETAALLCSLCNAANVSSNIIQTSAFYETGVSETEMVSTNGADIRQTVRFGGISMNAVARDGDIIQQRSINGHSALTYQGGRELFDPAVLLEKARNAGTEAVELLTAEPCPTGKRTLVLMPDQMMLQIHESVGHALEIDRILGDERNFAGGSFITLQDIGSFRYGSPLMNVSFDPTIAQELASYGADDIGNAAVKEYLIKDGILVRALGSLESQKRSGLRGVANQRACSWNRPPIDRMANLNLEPGSSSFDSIISSIENGILMFSNRSWSIDDYRNKFQFGCEYGKLIENGKLTKTVRDPNYRGISRYFWNSLCAVGDESTFEVFGTPNCGKGEPNQVIRVGHASPVCAFSDVEVFGGGK